MTEEQHPHFKGKDPLHHVAEAQANGIIASSEVHGTETPGHLAAASDAAKETAILSLLLWVFLPYVCIPPEDHLIIFTTFAFGWMIWKGGRGSWLAWSRLERLNRITAEEKYEIEHNRKQEREELRVLYEAKGFQGKHLEDVLDVLMADSDRLLRVMIEEELGLSLGVHEHPLKQGVGAACGVVFTITLAILGFMIYPHSGLLYACILSMGIASAVYSYLEKNRIIPGVVWNIGLAVLSFASVHFLLQFFFGVK